LTSVLWAYTEKPTANYESLTRLINYSDEH